MKAHCSDFLFDLYGTLADISTDEQKPYLWRKLTRELSRMGVEMRVSQARACYRQYADTAVREASLERGENAEPDFAVVFRQLLGERATAENIASLAFAFRMGSLNRLRLYPGVRETLQALHARGCGVYLVSNAQALYTRPELDMLRLTELFDGIALSSDYGYRKPAAEFYRAALHSFGLSPENCLMVGNDDIADCRGAAAAGLDSCYLYTAQSPRRALPLPPNTIELRAVSDVIRFAQQGA